MNLIAEFVFADTEYGNIARKLYEGGFLKTSSIGFIVKERQADNWRNITKCELLEWSLVAVPANPMAISLDAKEYKMALDSGLIKELVKDEMTTIKNELAEIKSMLKTLTDEGTSLEEEVTKLRRKRVFANGE